jgi:hypothetical protein
MNIKLRRHRMSRNAISLDESRMTHVKASQLKSKGIKHIIIRTRLYQSGPTFNNDKFIYSFECSFVRDRI